MIIKMTKSGRIQSVLDLGCGSGIYLGDLSGLFESVIGLDISRDNVLYSKRRIHFVRSNVETIQADGLCLPFKDAAFDLILISEVIEHVHESDANLMLKECNRTLKHHGYVVLTTPSPFLDLIPSEKRAEAFREYPWLKRFEKELFMKAVKSFCASYPEKELITESAPKYRESFHNFFIKKELRRLLERSGFVVKELKYVSKLTVVGEFVSRSIGQLVQRVIGQCAIRSRSVTCAGSESEFYKPPTPRGIWIERVPFFGKHILAICIKK